MGKITFTILFFLWSFELQAELLPQIRNTSCDLSKTSPLPKVQIVGVHHHQPNSDRVLERLLRDSANGRYPVATEVVLDKPFFPHNKYTFTERYGGSKETAKLHGIESEIPYWITTSYDTKMTYIMNGGVQAVEQKFNNVLKESSIDQAALIRLRQKAQNGEFSERLNIYIENYAQVVIDGNRSKTIDSIRPRGEAVLANFYNLMHEEVLNIANTTYRQHFNGYNLTPLTNGMGAMIQNTRTIHGGGKMNYVEMTIRDRDFANESANLLCHYQNEEKLVIVVGDGHKAGVVEHLNAMSNNKLIIEQFFAENEPDQTLCDVARICNGGVQPRGTPSGG